MFDPECQNIECPQCYLGKIYFDSEIGYYCMYCGNQFSFPDLEILIEKDTLMSRSTQQSDNSLKQPAFQIKELAPRKNKVVHTLSDTVKNKKSYR